MRYGLCANMDARDAWGVGFERIPVLKNLGYDYVELPLAQMVQMPEIAFEQEVLSRLACFGLRCETCNNLFPASVRLTGPEADSGRISEYVDRAMALAARAGAKVVVMGSSGARNLPEGVTIAEGYRDLSRALGILSPAAARHGIEIAIEPLNRLESNLLNSYLSSLYLAALSGTPNVGALVDAYHFGMGNEPLDNLLVQPPVHVHYAGLLGRMLPRKPDAFGCAFFLHLREAGYDRRVSLEGYAGTDFEASAAQALAAVRAMAGPS